MSDGPAPQRVIVAGTVRATHGVTSPVLAAMTAMATASKAEDGCELYSYAIDAFEPTLVRVFEIWSDVDALNKHRLAPHLKVWREQWQGLGLSDPSLSKYEISSEAAL